MWKAILRSIIGEYFNLEFRRWLASLPAEQAQNALRITEDLKYWLRSSSSSRTRALATILFGD